MLARSSGHLQRQGCAVTRQCSTRVGMHLMAKPSMMWLHVPDHFVVREHFVPPGEVLQGLQVHYSWFM